MAKKKKKKTKGKKLKKGAKKGKTTDGGGGGEENGRGPSAEQTKAAESIRNEFECGLLRYQLQSLQAKYDDLVASRTCLERTSLDDQKTYKDAEYFLNQKLDDQYNEIDRLEKKYLMLENEKELNEASWTEKCKRIEERYETELSALKREHQLGQQELLRLKEFADAKADTERRVREMERTIANNKDVMARELVEMDKRRVREKQQLRKEFERRLESASTGPSRSSPGALRDTTREAIEENKRMRSELQYQSKAVEKLMNANKQLVSENTQLHNEVEMQKRIQLEFAKKTQMYQKLVAKFNEKIQIHETRENTQLAKMKLRDKELADELVQIEQRREKLRDDVRGLRRHVADRQGECDALRRQLRELREHVKRRDELADDVVTLLLAGMEDVRVARRAMSGENETSDASSMTTNFTTMSVSARTKLLEVLLSRLQSEKITLLREAEILSGTTARRGVLPNLTPKQVASPARSTIADDREGPHTISPQTTRSMITTTSSSQTLTPQILQSPLREWGEPSKGLPRTLHRPDAFLKKNRGRP